VRYGERDMEGLARQVTTRIIALATVFALTLFLSAGTLHWLAGWVFLLLFCGFVVSLTVWLFRSNPELLVERMTGIGRPEQKAWDKLLLALTGVAFFAWLALSALDAVRFRWSLVPRWLQVVGGAALLASFALFYVTFRENPYLSPAVRLQTERAQTVVSTGPYRFVRHPMYSAFVLLALGTPLLLGSWYGLLGSVALSGMVGVRAVLEERVLRDELAGYATYMREVRYRLIPHVW
jgi:protein-S-isoprenylcysteine O-methyltransferase Ste14